MSVNDYLTRPLFGGPKDWPIDNAKREAGDLRLLAAIREATDKRVDEDREMAA